MNARSGRCSENCKFCAQSAHHHTGVDEYGFVEIDEIMEMALANQAEGADRFGLVTSGRRLDGEDFEHAIEAYKKMKANCSISLCAGHGLLRREQFKRLREAGVESYHENIETSRRNFPNICTTHKFEDKLGNNENCQRRRLLCLFRWNYRHGRNLGRQIGHGLDLGRARH